MCPNLNKRKIAATYIFTGKGKPLKNGIVICENDGTVLDIIDSSDNLTEQTGLEFYSGILVPGFVNACCRFEPSQQQQEASSEQTVSDSSPNAAGHPESVVNKKLFSGFSRKMWFNGIAAVGDISDTPVTFPERNSIQYHNIKLFVPRPDNLRLDVSHKKKSAEYTSGITQVENRIFQVCNTCFEESKMPESRCSMKNNFVIVCPLSSLSVENRLPPMDFFRSENFSICIGTHSLEANPNISMLDEMFALQQNFPELTLTDLIPYACLNGAQALKINYWAGSLDQGKRPGINLISGIDFKNMKLTANSRIKRLM